MMVLIWHVEYGLVFAVHVISGWFAYYGLVLNLLDWVSARDNTMLHM